ncbi:hsp70 nucleotide exchange factor fes1 [Coelomomyces lativittatus]|nr:hsp70 nucleotide exchange factor fes1 [Coelomomyces lativittatus]
MKDNMAIILNQEETLENRLTAFDDLELLVESIDNSNDLKACQLWEPLFQLLSDPLPEIRKFAGWVIATSIQNNPTATMHFLEMNGIQKYIERVDQEEDPDVISKLISISSALINQSHQYIPLLHSKGALKKFFELLLISPPFPASPRIFRLFTSIFSVLNNLELEHYTHVAIYVTHALFSKLIQIHVHESSTSMESCIQFLLVCQDHIKPRLDKECFLSLYSQIESLDVDSAIKSQVKTLAER